jgi:hypothetical protein
MNQILPRSVLGSLFLIVMTIAGCASATSTVSGKITYRGQPLTNGAVTIYSATGGVHSAMADAGGCYSISGVARGPAKITVTAHPPVPLGFQKAQAHPAFQVVLPGNGSNAAPSKALDYVRIPEKYGRVEQSGLRLEVAGGQHTFDISLLP